MAKKTKKKGGGGLVYPSEDLAEVINHDGPLYRTEVTKRIWKYIKDEGLNDGRTIHPDELLKPIIGSRPIDMLKLTSKVSAHLEKA